MLDVQRDAALTSVNVDLDADLFGQCVLTFNDPKLQIINGKDFNSGTAVKVEIGFHTKLKKIFEGEVVALEPVFRRDSPPSIKIVCQDSLHRLALSQMTRAFNDVDDKQIATKIAQEHGLTAQAPSGTKEHILQGNVTDAAFLRRLAAKSGNTLRMEGKKLIIGPPPKGADVQVSPADGLTKIKVKIKANAQVGEVSVHGWDPKTKKEIIAKAKPTGEIQKGAKEHGRNSTLSIAGHEHMPADTATAEAMAKGRLAKIAEGFIVASGDMVGDPRVVPGAVLALDGLGAQIDGRYRVDHAAHFFSKHGYLVRFKAVRVGKKKPPAKAVKPQQRPQGGAATNAEQQKGKDKANHGLINPRWGKQDHEHSDYGEMICDCKNIDGKMVEFIAYHQEPDGNWTEFVRKHVVASGTEVRAKIKLLHEDHPDTAKATKEGSKRPVDEMLFNARWAQTDHQHGEEGEMLVDVRHGNEGAPVVFVVEKKGPNGWEPYGTVDAKVDGDQARAKLSMMHPEGSTPTDTSQPVEIRFTAHIQIESGSRAVKFDAHIL
jgi:phage protein D